MRHLPWMGLPALLFAGLAAAQGTALVRVEAPQRSSVAETLNLTGSVTAERDADLSPRVSGLVQRVRVDAGDRVSKGDTLIEFDDRLAALALRRADAALAEGRALLDESRRLREEGERLSADGSIPRSQFLTREAEYAAAQAALARLQAERDEQAELLARHRVVAPFDGVVTRRFSDEGEWVATGTPVLQLVATDPLRIDVRMPQRQLGSLDERTRIEVRLDALPDRRFDARLGASVPVADPSTRTFLARVLVDNDEGLIAPGMSARVRFEVGAPTPVLLVPRDAVRRNPDGPTTVWIAEDADGQSLARERRVELGGARGEQLVVISGLDDTARVIVRGNEGLRENQPLQMERGG
ncbi:MAG: efflux RND transporter periplasmic adaptor subunit [Pseudomonadota bacterium]|nr:efflux RND transporter periplasmic adaptor subunit [Pseudomonadota bacterium]